ncbi:MAG: cation:proton antiporter [Hyphomicrobiales bacterium]|nr:cation:proton antiporter [Hyphomicrobiales bacterium]
MHHDTSLIAIVAIGFVLATIFGYIADRLRLPTLVGYLVAGVCVGPFTPGFVADPALAGQLAELGVILLMFGVGLHFSVSDLLAVRGLAVPGAIGQIVVATLLGMGLSSLWGWTTGEGIVFGLSLSVASTVVLLKALEQGNLVSTPMGRAAIGWLIVEDLAMVLALVLLPAFAEMLGGHPISADGGHDAGAGGQSVLLVLGVTLIKVAAFTALAVVLGPKIVPGILTRAARTGSRELFTLTVLAIALGIAFGSAAAFGVSFALGAFFAGVVMSESHLSHRAAANSLPLQDAFSVLFFVSIGMLFNPMVIVEAPGKVLGVLAIIMIGKSIVAVAIVLLLRYPVGMALGIGASLAQVGEFSFILAGLGIAHGLLSEEGQDLILAGALLSVTLNPLALLAVGIAQKWMQTSGPSGWSGFGRAKLRALVHDLEVARAAAEAREHEQERQITELLGTFPLFSRIDKSGQEELLLLFRPQTAAPGDRIIRAGDRGTTMYFITSGKVDVTVHGKVFRLDAGSFFGEMALLSGERRTADVTAVDFCQLLVLERRDFNQFMSRHPELREAVNEMADRRKALNLQGSAGEA